MKVQDIFINKLKPYENNPRKNKASINKVAESIKQFGFQQPIVVDKNYVIVVGDTRYKAAKKLNILKVPVIIADKLTDKQIKAYRLIDNKVGETPWDDDKLIQELKELDEMQIDINMSDFGFENFDIEEDSDDKRYTDKIKIPTYEIKRENKPKLSELFNMDKTKELIKDIEDSNIDIRIKKFLKIAAYRHVIFDYSEIAEYYAHTNNKEVQRLMEKLALVIIDYNKAIEYGFVNLTKKIIEVQNYEKGK